MKMMFCLVDFCGKELTECLGKATTDGKFPPRSTTNIKFKLQTLHALQGHTMHPNLGISALSVYRVDRPFMVAWY
jgi:hypothetical protein